MPSREESASFPTVLVDGVFFQIANTGIARVWISLLEEWVRTGFARHLVLLDRVGPGGPGIEGIRQRSLPAYDLEESGADAEVCQSICEEEGADLFISTYYTTPTTTPSVFMAYDMIPETLGMDLDRPVWREKRYALLHASHYVTISASTARDLRRLYPHISEDDVTVAHCGVSPVFSPAEPTAIGAFRSEFRIDRPYVLVVGERLGLGGYKNVSLLLRAVEQAPWRDDVEIVCVGGPPELEPELRAVAENVAVSVLKLSDEQLNAAYSGAIALVYPSLYEGFGLPVVEAMASECPVITCRVASIPEVAGDAVIYVDPAKPEELARALDAVREPRRRASLAAAGRRRAGEFTWKRMAEIVAAALVRTAQKRRTAAALDRPVWAEFRRLQSELQRQQRTSLGPGVRFLKGWHKNESNADENWRWSTDSAASVELAVIEESIEGTLVVKIGTLEQASIRLMLNGKLLAELACPGPPMEHRIPAVRLKPGRHRLEFESDIPPRQASEADRRHLGFALYRVEIAEE